MNAIDTGLPTAARADLRERRVSRAAVDNPPSHTSDHQRDHYQ
jgi:hypothetical protein